MKTDEEKKKIAEAKEAKTAEEKAEIEAKTSKAAKKAEAKDRTPEQALEDDWKIDVKRKEIGPYITVTGRMRGGLKPSQQKKAQEILKGYGF